MSSLFFATAARSAIGLQRNGNEDSALTSGQVIAVADGMGGHAAGEVASRIAITKLEEISSVICNPEIDPDSAEDIFSDSLTIIDSQLKSESNENPQLSGMGTTLTALYICGERISLLHIGDSRAYRLRGSSFEQLTQDHTVIQ
jgi:serine/threonine protein phosphatase PrpC